MAWNDMFWDNARDGYETSSIRISIIVSERARIQIFQSEGAAFTPEAIDVIVDKLNEAVELARTTEINLGIGPLGSMVKK